MIPDVTMYVIWFQRIVFVMIIATQADVARAIQSSAETGSNQFAITSMDQLDSDLKRLESLFLVDNVAELTEAEYELIVAEHEAFIDALARRPVLDTRLFSLIPGISGMEFNLLARVESGPAAAEFRQRLAGTENFSEQTTKYLEFADRYVKTVAAASTLPDSKYSTGDVPESTDLYTGRHSESSSRAWTGRATLRIEKSHNSSTAVRKSFIQSLRTTAKIIVSGDNFTSSIAARNDPSEPFQWRPDIGWYGFDHVTGYLRWHPTRYPVQITLGNYSLDYGQGLLWSRPFGQRRDATAPHRSLRHSSGIRGHASASGSSFLTGIAAKLWPLSTTEITFFVSQRKYDARPPGSKCDSECVSPYVVEGLTNGWQLSTSDQHTTEEQLSRKNAVRSKVVGAVLVQRFSTFSLGISSAQTVFDKPFKWQQRSSAAHDVLSSSLFWLWATRFITVSGELSIDRTIVSGGVVGAVIRPDKRLRGIVLFRYYDGQRTGLHARASGLSASLASQWGLVLGWRYSSRKRWILSASIEFHTGKDVEPSFPGNRHNVDARIFAEIRPVRRARFRIYIRQKRTLRSFSISSPDSPAVNYPEIASIEQFSAELLFDLSARVQTRLRSDLNTARIGSTDLGTGFQVYQQFDIKVSRRLSFTFRASVFESDNSLNRTYVYEPDVSGKLIAPSNSGTGYNLLVLARASSLAGVKLEIKVSTRSYSDTFFDVPVLNVKKTIEYKRRHQITFQLSRSF